MNVVDVAEFAKGGAAQVPQVGQKNEVAPGAQPVRFRWADNAVFAGFHTATAVMVYLAGVPTWGALGLCLFAYLVGMFAITAGYHRYFSHRTYRTSRAFQFIMALLGTLTLQKGVLWWAAHHRKHHKYSDTEKDIHSPFRHGFWWAHMGWIMSPAYMATDLDQVKDLARFRELRWLNDHFILPTVPLCALVLALGGFQAMVWGCFVSVVLLWHGTFTINSLSHLWGSRTYATTDTSRNNALLALITLGEGWHNNHHFHAASVRQGFRWWQLDVSYIVLCVLEKLGIVWGLKRPTDEVVAGFVGGKCHKIGATNAETVEPTGIVAEHAEEPAAAAV